MHTVSEQVALQKLIVNHSINILFKIDIQSKKSINIYTCHKTCLCNLLAEVVNKYLNIIFHIYIIYYYPYYFKFTASVYICIFLHFSFYLRGCIPSLSVFLKFDKNFMSHLTYVRRKIFGLYISILWKFLFN